MNFFRALMVALFAAPLFAADRPNVVWIMSEDNSIHYLDLYHPGGAATPNIAALAARGLTFDHAFSNAPVCSVARTSLITSCYAPRVGTQFHRRSKPAVLPDRLKLFPAYLREAGYYATNNSKEDYNAEKSPDVWDDSSQKAHWRNRSTKEQPFFHVQTYGDSHESSLHVPADRPITADPAAVTLAPYHPDTDIFRRTHARYLDRIGEIDRHVGELVAQLEADGLLEDTFIFYFGDHGGVLPRGKGFTYESGLHIPLVVRVPEKWAHLVDARAGTRVDGFVSFVDFGPTVLNLAGVAAPKGIDGRAFLGKGVSLAEVNARDEAFGYADRMDEKYDLTRWLRKGKFAYHRNYEAFYPDALQNNYRYLMPAYQEWRALFEAGKLEGPSRQFFEPKAPEALYDIESDPHEVHNLADEPQYAAVLAEMRGRLRDRVRGMPDLSFYPESVLIDSALPAAAAFGQTHRGDIARMIDLADLAIGPLKEDEIRAAMKSESPWDRYWALTACCVRGETAKSLADAAKPLLADAERLNRVRAAVFLSQIGAADPRPVFQEALATSDNSVETMIILNMAVYLKDFGPKIDPGITRAGVKSKGAEVERRLFYFTGEGGPQGNKSKPKAKAKKQP